MYSLRIAHSLTHLPGAGVPLTSPRLYSAAASDDLKCAALYVHSLFPRAKLVGVGFSLGANVLTRYLGEEGEQSLLSSGCAMACVRRASVAPSRSQPFTYSLSVAMELGREFYSVSSLSQRHPIPA